MHRTHTPRPFRHVGNPLPQSASKPVATLYLFVNGARVYLDRRPARAGETPALADMSEQCDGCGHDIARSLEWRPASALFRCDCGATFGIRSDK